jgi:hypothetical protein
MRSYSSLAVASACILVVFVAGCNARRAPMSPDGNPNIGDERIVFERTCSPEAGGGPIVPDALRERALSAGAVRVIVRLNVPGAVEPENAAYLASITQTQDALLGELAGRTFTVTARFRTVPLLGLQATPGALDVLAASSHVVCVQEDALARPMGN